MTANDTPWISAYEFLAKYGLDAYVRTFGREPPAHEEEQKAFQIPDTYASELDPNTQHADLAAETKRLDDERFLRLWEQVQERSTTPKSAQSVGQESASPQSGSVELGDDKIPIELGDVRAVLKPSTSPDGASDKLETPLAKPDPVATDDLIDIGEVLRAAAEAPQGEPASTENRKSSPYENSVLLDIHKASAYPEVRDAVTHPR